MKRLFAALLLTLPASAHMVSISTGEARLDGARLHYRLEMPSFELTHVAEPERVLLRHVLFRSRGQEARLTSSACHTQEATFVCEADYEFPAPADALSVECTLASVTVANHVHVLHAYRGALTDQAVFDVSFPNAELRFRPPTAFESGMEGAGFGFLRALQGVAAWLFLLGLALAARTWRAVGTMFAAFVFGETFAARLVGFVPWALSPRFLEAAAALTVAWLAFEILFLPDARRRWIVVGALGIFHGMYFSMFLAESNYPPWPFLAGLAGAELVCVVALMGMVRGLQKFGKTAIIARAAAALLMTGSLGWFIVRIALG